MHNIWFTCKLFQLRWWIVYGLASWILAMPQNLMYFEKILFSHKESTKNFLRFIPIWLEFQPQPNLFLLWFGGLGFYLPLYVLAFFILPEKRKYLHFQFGFIVLFILSNFILYQPWVLDNTKIFYISIFGFSPVIAHLLYLIWSGRLPFISKLRSPSKPNIFGEDFARNSEGKRIFSVILKSIAALLFIILIFTGFLCLISETNSKSTLLNRVDIESGMWFYENTPHDAKVLVSTRGTHFRPAAAIGGRQLISSYWGWISNHGMPNYELQNSKSNAILDGSAGAIDFLIELGVNYIVLDWNRYHEYNLHFIHSIANVAASNGKYTIYQVLPKHLLSVREDCMTGVPAADINPNSCKQRGCIWMPNDKKLPWCVSPPVWNQTEENRKPIDCGWYGITDQSCHAVGCQFVSFHFLFLLFPLI